MSLINMFVAARAALASRHQRQRAYDELASLDDRSLADIGLHRSQLSAVVEGFHEPAELEASANSMLPSVRYSDDGLSLGQTWLRRI